MVGLVLYKADSTIKKSLATMAGSCKGEILNNVCGGVGGLVCGGMYIL